MLARGIEIARGAVNQSRLRLSAVAVDLQLGALARKTARRDGADNSRCDRRKAPCRPSSVSSLLWIRQQIGFAALAARDHRLVRDHAAAVFRFVQPPDCRLCSRQQLELFRRVQVIDLAVEGAVAVDEHDGLRPLEARTGDPAGTVIRAGPIEPGRRADVLDVLRAAVAAQQEALLQHGRKQVLGEVERPRRDPPGRKRVPAHPVKGGIHQVRVPARGVMRIGMKADHPLLGVDLHQVRILRVVVRVQEQGRRGGRRPGMECVEALQVDFQHRIAVHHQEFRREPLEDRQGCPAVPRGSPSSTHASPRPQFPFAAQNSTICPAA